MVIILLICTKKPLCTVVCRYAMINGGFFSPEFKRFTMSNPMNYYNWWCFIDKRTFFPVCSGQTIDKCEQNKCLPFFAIVFFSYCNWRDYTVIYNDIYVFLGLVCKKKSSIYIQ